MASKDVAEKARAASAAGGEAAGAALAARPGAAGADLATSTRLADFRRNLDEETAIRALLGEWIKANMTKDTDFGTIPGTPKPTLYKPGAEKLVALFKCTPVYRLEKKENFGGDGSKPFFSYEFRCRLQLDGGKVLAEGYGSANSHETKYRYRFQRPKCPSCGQDTVRKSTFADGGFYCHRKQGGCGAQFKGAEEKAITSQPLGKVDDPDVADKANTLLKMAKKRALVDAALALARVSDMFTQDVEDHRDEPAEEPPFTPGDGPPGEEPPPPGEEAGAAPSRTAAAKERMRGKTGAAPGNSAAAASKDDGPLMEFGDRDTIRGKPIRQLTEEMIRAHIGVGVDWLGKPEFKANPSFAKVSKCVDDLKAELAKRNLAPWEPKPATGTAPPSTPAPADAPKSAAPPPPASPAPASAPPSPPAGGREPGEDQDEIPFGGAA